MDERPSDTDAPEYAEPPLSDDDAPAGVEPPDYAEPPLDEPPIDLEPPKDAGLLFDEPLVDLEPSDYVEYSFGAEPPASLEQIDDGEEAPIEAEAPAVDLRQTEMEPWDYAEPTDAEPPTSLEQSDYGDELPIEAEAPWVAPVPAEAESQDNGEPTDADPPTSLEQIDYGDDLSVEAGAPTVDLAQAETELQDDAEPPDEEVIAAVDSEPASTEPPAYAEPPSDAEIPDYATALLVDEGPGGAVLYQAFVPRRMRRDQLAAMSYPKAIDLVGKWRKKGDPAELGELDMSDEEIAAAIQDYARGVDTEEERTNWLLGQILEEQFRQTRHLRGVKTVLILLIAALALAAIASCVLMFVQIPNLVP